MKLYNSIGPNPRVVRIFFAEKGVEVPMEAVDLMGGENRQAPYLERNPAGQLPCLELDDGSYLSEILAICEYIDEKHPEPALIGTTAEERAETRMWTRRIDLGVAENIFGGFRYAEGLPLFKDRMRTIPAAADDLKANAQDKLEWLDGQLAGREWVCGDRYTVADILLFGVVEFAGSVGQPLRDGLTWLPGWFERVAKRSAVEASK
ncbi:MAG: glutathione S-transferase family protein [Deltaproteobacteria bacterium]|nr:glutathione S-transferase family protein [Deltaproteobacteria bacterium]MBW2445774.1 glutathione S-transferase family protein [Deltaproteobacteria bacterium]